MIQPEALKKNEPLLWATGTGTDVWELFCSCTSGDLEAVKRLCAKDPSLVRTQYAYRSPIYFAEGLKGSLLICHGMVDTNVLFQDTVRLTQRLIELRKTNWSVAPFPVENHGFEEETSWADEYRRILKLFDDNLKNHDPRRPS